MGSINKSHNEADGGVLLFNGELILLYCDSVNCEIGGKESFKGRVYLTTHRLVIIVAPYRQNAPVKSICAPFCAIQKCTVEQPVFGANYIEATVRDEADSNKTFSFKLKFSKGGAIELALAMNRAVAAVGRNFNASMPPPPAYTPSPTAQYYQAPPTVYAPGYNTGVQMPVQQFPDQPPIGFIYASEAPPPYPGIGGGISGAGPQAYNQQQQPQSGYPGYQGQQQPSQGGYPQAGGYQPQQQPGGYQPQQPVGYPQQPSGYPQQPQGYPQQQQQTGYTQQPSEYPQQPSGYPQQQQQPAAGQQPPAAGYPDLSQVTSGGYPGGSAPPQQQQFQNNAWPTAPSFNPNYQEDKKNV